MNEPKDLQELTADWLKSHGYDGLCAPNEACGCGVANLMPCAEPYPGCIPAYQDVVREGDGDVDPWADVGDTIFRQGKRPSAEEEK